MSPTRPERFFEELKLLLSKYDATILFTVDVPKTDWQPEIQNIPLRTPGGTTLRKSFAVSNLADVDYGNLERRIAARYDADDWSDP